MQVAISSGLLERIVGLAAADPTREVCGLLLGQGNSVEDILPAPNIADDPVGSFEVDPAIHFDAIRAVRAGGPAVIGCFHSHPSGNAVPSATDAAMIGWVGAIWLICAGHDVRVWRADTPRSFVEVTLVPQPSACVTS